MPRIISDSYYYKFAMVIVCENILPKYNSPSAFRLKDGLSVIYQIFFVYQYYMLQNVFN